jgi:diaminohydroxyphosphoribosylaminopyrimidine deaminase/5-amino-6-(5-phosphoribosylamino)uracil reductase
MQTALELARRGWGRTSPNPMVGAVVVRNGEVVGEGYHHRAGEAHAEVVALDAAGSATSGSTLYVTLEPCSTHGRTPPCTEAIRRAGIRRVVVGTLDPNPKHRGAGCRLLQEFGVSVEAGVLADECERLNDAFFWWITTGRPFVLLKMAMTLDGKIATASGRSQWITGPPARARVQHLRQWADAVIVGGETVRCDNPSLTVREPAEWTPQPRRVVWTRAPERLGPEFRIWDDPERPPTFVQALSREEWEAALSDLGREGVTALLVEGGGELAGAMLAAGVVNRIEFHIATRILGGRGSRPVVGGADPLSLEQAHALAEVTVENLGQDLAVSGYLRRWHGEVVDTGA